jgi:DNA invertase Pin-like site-specific DNA recombinase
MKTMPKAYSYLRFSTPEQSKGDSRRRQNDAARAYAKRNGLDLDAKLTFQDLGVSAFRGKNREKGALGLFLAAVKNGRIPRGSYLLVEDFDRLSRDSLDNAYDLFRSILKLGINIATLDDDEKLYTPASLNNLNDMIRAQTRMDLAHAESLKKSNRISGSWKNKRDNAQADGKKLTARCPAWLTLASDRKSFTVDSARKKIVRRIFDMTIAGHGKSVIARQFNADGVPTFGDSEGWNPSYVQKILESEAVTGMFQPMRIEVKGGKKARVPDGEPIADYFPPVIDAAIFERARRSRASRRIPAGRKGETFSNLFSGIAVCGNCGAPMHYVNKGEGPKGGAYLSCSNARRAVSNCKAPSWRYSPLEALLILHLEGLDYGQLFPDLTRDSRAKLRELEDRKLETESELAQTEQRLENIGKVLADNPGQPTMLKQLNERQATFDKLTATLKTLDAQLEEERDRVKNTESDFRGVQDGLQRLHQAHRMPGAALYDLRSRLHQQLKRTIQVQGIALSPLTAPEFAPGTLGERTKLLAEGLVQRVEPGRSSEFVGAVSVRFESTNIVQTIFVTKGFKTCVSLPLRFRDGKVHFKKDEDMAFKILRV